MYDLIPAGENTFYIECPAKIGIWRTAPDTVWLIDAGGDKDAARRISKLLAEMEWRLAGVVNTHSNADHMGGNAALRQRTGCKIIAPPLEDAFLRHTLLEPSFLYGGYPTKGMRGKFLMAPPCEVDGSVPEDLPPGLTHLPLPGHFFNMGGYRTGDNVVFLADALFGDITIQRYHAFFIYDVAGFLETLDRIEKMEASLFVPSHAPVCEDIRPLVRQNRDKVLEIAGLILELCKAAPRDSEEVLKGLFDHYSLELDLSQYLLVGSTVRSYLSYLVESGGLVHHIQDNRLLYRPA